MPHYDIYEDHAAIVTGVRKAPAVPYTSSSLPLHAGLLELQQQVIRYRDEASSAACSYEKKKRRIAEAKRNLADSFFKKATLARKRAATEKKVNSQLAGEVALVSIDC